MDPYIFIKKTMKKICLAYFLNYFCRPPPTVGSTVNHCRLSQLHCELMPIARDQLRATLGAQLPTICSLLKRRRRSPELHRLTPKTSSKLIFLLVAFKSNRFFFLKKIVFFDIFKVIQ